jgi:hypothetical protein
MYLSSSGKKVASLVLPFFCSGLVVTLQDAFTIAWRHGPFVIQ